jgi:YHS domain-containing protein
MGIRKLVVAVGVASAFLGADFAARAGDLPVPFAPFEYLIGSWKGNGVPTANKIRGWGETHAWAWRFENGAPVGLSVVMTGDKLLAAAKLSYDAASQTYRLEGTDPEKKPVAFTGALDKAGKKLTLDRVGVAPDGSKQQIALFPNANFVRYTLWITQKEPGAPQFKRTIEIGVKKEGESFAAGGSAADLPKCIVTGGAATLTVSYQGKSFPLCCTGCKAEFDENPEKYVKKAALRAEAAAKTPAKPTASVGKDDGAFDGLGDEPKAKPKDPGKAKGATAAEKTKPALEGGPQKVDRPKADPAARAASLLKIGQNLEKSGKAAAALGYYRQVVKDYANTPAAKTAAERVKALEPE